MEMVTKCLIGVALSLALVACNSLPSASLPIHLDASKQINLDQYATSLPVRIKLYQLRDATLFNEATFRQLWKEDTKTLGTTLLAKKELTLTPGSSETIRMPRQKEAEYIAVIGVFRRHEQTHWKAIKRLPNTMTALLKPIVVMTNRSTVEIQ